MEMVSLSVFMLLMECSLLKGQSMLSWLPWTDDSSRGLKEGKQMNSLASRQLWLDLECFVSICTVMGGAIGKADSVKDSVPASKLEAKMVEAMRRRAVAGSTMKSFNTIILKFPKIDESLRNCKAIFEQFDEDSNGSIDPEELKHCFHKLEVDFTEEEITDIFKACDIDENLGIMFNEFVVLLCLVFLLKEPINAQKTGLCLPDLEATFQILVDAFVFLDKNKDGYVSKSEMVEAINESTTGGRSSGRIAMRRFEEMDWDRNGMVTFKEFLFAFTRWLGIGDGEEEDE
ncbi:hypothetical protein HPP92_017314 [Vanilla planifolia]|uniref:EF-hand domain-containing protein n=1 Tax=Vanilla planifolia TaxID=51239 RepID=A0A835QC03_VANPL|nr:hypothetical protein HPP92_017314 [Vanilla planifolia]